MDQHGFSAPGYAAARSSSPPLSSSPANGLMSPTRTRRRKEKRNPSVTPRRFGRFFTPRSSQPINGRRILANVDSEELNRQPISPQSLLGDGWNSDGLYSSPLQDPASPSGHGRKRSGSGQEESMLVRRRGAVPNDMQPPRLNLPTGRMNSSSPADISGQDVLGDWRKATLGRFFRTSRGQDHFTKESLIRDACLGPSAKRQRLEAPEHHEPVPVQKFVNRGYQAQLLDREHGFAFHTGRQYLTFPAGDARAETANFYSNARDSQVTAHFERPGETTPFCQASCHDEAVTAIGDEQGYVRLLRTDGWHNGMNKTESFFKAQDNAIIDMDISNDDMRLATACGDWSTRVFDLTTQSAVIDLKGHTSGLRQVHFQPGRANSDVLATAAKDGCINVWDLRCSALPVQAFSTKYGDKQRVTRRDTALDVFQASPVNNMALAHVRSANGHKTPASITSFQWFPSGREHLLVSGSEVSASIKLWDIRCIKPRHSDAATPLAVTAEPQHHTFRSYGLTSLALNSDATRLYSVCKDSTIYAYSTAHLILGQAPELSTSSVKRKPRAVQGIGPLYGWKNEQLNVMSFWIKSAVRPARGLQTELLAVGSTSKCPILFPTDERYMRSAFDQRNHILDYTSTSTLTPSLSASRSTPSSLNPSSANIPIFRCGTPLINGHDKEVSTVSWTHTGRLVSLSDDGSVRHWQQDDANRARQLRQVGDFGGERWNAGWADVGEDWDEDEDEG